MQFSHVPVMSGEVVRYLNCEPGKIYADGTLGGSGHARAILAEILPKGILIGIDQDMDAILHAENALKDYSSNIRLFHDNFIHLPDILYQLDIDAVDGILLDLGLSLHQLETSGRGFSFNREDLLDMRMNSATGRTAGDIVNTTSEGELRKIFKEFGEERWAGPIARRIIRERQRETIKTTTRLAEIVCGAIPKKARRPLKIHPATRVFMALRIAVNRELECLESFMETVADLLNPGGRLCVISFHSLEDRIVKHRIREMASACQCPPDFPKCVCEKKPTMRAVVRKAIRPSDEEIAANPKSRSAILRVAEKVPVSHEP
jgi:16S rRNA (cytosine1402-N4)-methyltransferase